MLSPRSTSSNVETPCEFNDFIECPSSMPVYCDAFLLLLIVLVVLTLESRRLSDAPLFEEISAQRAGMAGRQAVMVAMSGSRTLKLG
jgi:hypothetical protein